MLSLIGVNTSFDKKATVNNTHTKANGPIDTVVKMLKTPGKISFQNSLYTKYIYKIRNFIGQIGYTINWISVQVLLT